MGSPFRIGRRQVEAAAFGRRRLDRRQAEGSDGLQPRRHAAAHQQRHPVAPARERDIGGGVLPRGLVLPAYLLDIEA